MAEAKKKAAKKVAKKTTTKKAASKNTVIKVIEDDVSEKRCKPPIANLRNEYGLLITKEHVFDEDGFVDWREMINKKHVVVNTGWFQNNQSESEVPSKIDGLRDDQLIIKLAAFKELAKVRGFRSIDYEVISSSMSLCVVKCTISWLETYETGYKATQTSEVANASIDNTGEFAIYLETIATNRAFARCVRNALGINIVSSDELSLKGSDTASITAPENAEPTTSTGGGSTGVQIKGAITPIKIMQDLLMDSVGGNSFEDLMKILRFWYKEGIYDSKDPANWSSFKDIPEQSILEILPRLKNPTVKKK